MDKKQTGIFNLATGFGKTRMMSILALAYKRANPNGRVLIVVPSTSLIKDENGDGVVKKFHVYNKDDLKSDGELEFGTYYGKGIKSTETEFTVTTYASLAKYARNINPKDIGLLLLDEAHHALSETRSEIIRQFSEAAQYGMTATPGYDPEKDLENLLENYIASVTIEEAIKEGDLANTKNVILVSGTPVDLTKVPKIRGSSGDYDPKEYMKAIARAMNAHSVTSGNEDNWKEVHRRISRQIAEFYRDYEDDEAGKIFGKKCMINCRSQEEARITALSINKVFGKMMAATYVSGNTGTENETVLKSFVDGNLPILCQVGKLSEGFDFPDLDIVFNFPTHSRVREAQLGGRAIRTPSDRKRKKTALVVDIAFAHPDGKNVIDAIHRNGQVLFQDIMGAPIIQKPEEKGPKPDPELNDPEPRVRKPAIKLKDFYIISDKRTLLYLSNEAKRIEAERAKEEAELRDGYTSTDLAEVIDIRPKAANKLIKRYKNKKVVNPETGEEEPCTKMVYSKTAGAVLGLTKLGFEKVIKDWREEHEGITAPEVVKKLHIKRSSASDLIKSYKGKTVLNPETGEEEPCTKMVTPKKGPPVLGFTKLGWELALKEWQEKREGIPPSEVSKKLNNMPPTTTRRFIKRYEGRKVINPETGKEEPCTKRMKDQSGQDCIGFTKLGWELALKERQEKREDITLADVAEKMGISEATARKFIDRYEGRKVINPETGEEEPCTKMVSRKKCKPHLGFTKLGFEKALQDWEKEHEGVTLGVVAEKMGIDRESARKLIDHYEGKKVINPETGKEEDCTKMVTDDTGNSSLGFTKLGFEKALKDWEKEHEGVTLADVAEKMGIKKDTARKLIDRYEGKKVINPETGKEEDCTKMITPPRGGKPHLGFTKLGWELALKEYQEKQKRTASSTLRPRLEAGSTQDNPKVSPAQKGSTPEI